MRRIYLDHASTSPLRDSARRAMVDWLGRQEAGEAGDPGRIHAEGMASRVALEGARERVADWLGVRPREVVFTSGATESIAAACFGARARIGPDAPMVGPGVEHSAVRQWMRRGPCTEVAVDRLGRVDPDELLAAAGEDTALLNLQWANHEVATRQPVAEVVPLCRERGLLVHVDAAQAVHEAPAAASAGADLVSLSGHKLGGPTGTGVLIVRRGVRLPALLVGGDQERARRAGMEDVAGALGLAAVADELAADGPAEATRLGGLTAAVRRWAETAEGVQVLGDPHDAVGHLVCLGLDGVEPQPVLLGLDRLGVAVHSGSSCSSEAIEASPVLAAMGVDAERSLRVSVGWSSTEADVHTFLEQLEVVLGDLRSLGRRG